MNHSPPAPTPETRVVILDESGLFRLGLRTSLEAQSDFTVVEDYETAAAALAEIEEIQPNVVLMSVSLPDPGSFVVCFQMLELAPDARVIMMSSQLDGTEILATMLAGGAGYLPKDSPEFELVRMVRYQGQGSLYQIPAVAKFCIRNMRARGSFVDMASLSDRERKIVVLIANGQKNSEVGDSLGLSQHTVRSHLRHIFHKLGVSSRAELAALVPLLAVMNIDLQTNQRTPGRSAP